MLCDAEHLSKYEYLRIVRAVYVKLYGICACVPRGASAIWILREAQDFGVSEGGARTGGQVGRCESHQNTQHNRNHSNPDQMM